jgi:hypothetical protein
MQFYSLDEPIEGDADTWADEEYDYNQGDAARCPACGSAVSMLPWLPPLRVVLQLYGNMFGDFVFLHGGADFLVSQKFRDAYYQHGLTGLLGFDPVQVIMAKSRRKHLGAPPRYFRVCANYGQTALDLASSEFEWLEKPTCPVCRTATIVRWKRLVVDQSTWTGEDAFRPRGMAGETMVSQRFKDACEQHDIKNAVFTPAEVRAHDFYPGRTGTVKAKDSQ